MNTTPNTNTDKTNAKRCTSDHTWREDGKACLNKLTKKELVEFAYDIQQNWCEELDRADRGWARTQELTAELETAHEQIEATKKSAEFATSCVYQVIEDYNLLTSEKENLSAELERRQQRQMDDWRAANLAKIDEEDAEKELARVSDILRISELRVDYLRAERALREAEFDRDIAEAIRTKGWSG